MSNITLEDWMVLALLAAVIFVAGLVAWSEYRRSEKDPDESDEDWLWRQW